MKRKGSCIHVGFFYSYYIATILFQRRIGQEDTFTNYKINLTKSSKTYSICLWNFVAYSHQVAQVPRLWAKVQYLSAYIPPQSAVNQCCLSSACVIRQLRSAKQEY